MSYHSSNRHPNPYRHRYMTRDDREPEPGYSVQIDEVLFKDARLTVGLTGDRLAVHISDGSEYWFEPVCGDPTHGGQDFYDLGDLRDHPHLCERLDDPDLPVELMYSRVHQEKRLAVATEEIVEALRTTFQGNADAA